MLRNLFTLLLLVVSGLAIGQTTIRLQSFESSGDDWGYTYDPDTFNTSGDVWMVVQSLSGQTTMPSVGSNFWGVQDLENSNGGTAGYGTLMFDSIHLGSLTNAYVRFDWDINGFDSGDTVKYEVFEDGVSQGLTVILGGTGSSGDGTIDHAVTNGTDSIRLNIYVKQNGGSDNAGFDNVRLDTGALSVASTPYYNISTINTVDGSGEPDSIGVYSWTSGVVVGVDLDGNTGLSFTIMDTLGGGVNGINVFNFNDVSNYSVLEGDSILIRGEIDFYNGLLEFVPDSIELLNQSNPIPDTATVTSLGESTESELVKFENALITAISGSNYTLVSGTDTIVMRVDSDTDVDDSLTFVIGDSLCWVVGIGGQFDASSPYFDGYQIFPRYYTDVDTSCGGPAPPSASVPIYPIGTIETVDSNGEPDSNGVVCGIQGLVLGVDLQGTSSNNSFTVVDNTGGIAVFAFGGFTPAYTVTEGDSVIVYGTIDQFNGLAQVAGDSMMVLSSGNSLPTPALVTDLDESTESEYIELHNLVITAISGSNYDVVNGTDTLVMRVDSDTDVDDSLSFAVGDTICSLIGIGGQFDASSPYFDGYQVFPHHYYDVELCDSTSTPPPTPTAPFYPIPTINTDDANGEPDSIGVYCWTQGIVLGLDLRGGNGISFTIYDDGGINVFNFNDVSGYTVTEGDSIRLRGEIDFYNGLTEIIPDSIEVMNSGNSLPAELNVSVPSGMTESAPMVIANVEYNGGSGTWPDPANFTGSANVELVNCDGDTIVMRIDSDTDIDENWFADSTMTMTIHGIGGQFDGSSPYTSGYQIFPMYTTDIDTSETEVPMLNINEVMSDNVSEIADENGDFDDWIELYNPTSGDISLAGLFVTNDDQDPGKYQIPLGSTEMITAGGYALVWCDNESSEGDLHSNFELDAAGTFVGLVVQEGCDFTAVDTVTVPALGADESFGRETDGGTPWVVFTDATPDADNETSGVKVVSGTNFTAYPNPNGSGVLNFTEQVSISIYNITGQVVLQAQRTIAVDINSLESGIYIVENQNKETLKLIVQ